MEIINLLLTKRVDEDVDWRKINFVFDHYMTNKLQKLGLKCQIVDDAARKYFNNILQYLGKGRTGDPLCNL